MHYCCSAVKSLSTWFGKDRPFSANKSIVKLIPVTLVKNRYTYKYNYRLATNRLSQGIRIDQSGLYSSESGGSNWTPGKYLFPYL